MTIWNAFQFSLWDSHLNFSYWLYWLFPCFQFSLWDSKNVLHTVDWASQMTFNSLYEIHNSLYIRYNVGACVLSILSMRFAEKHGHLPEEPQYYFQFSLWDSQPLLGLAGPCTRLSLSILSMRFKPSWLRTSQHSDAPLSILSMRFWTWTEVVAVPADVMFIPFNSLYEILLPLLCVYFGRGEKTFNSLYEIQLHRREPMLGPHPWLSILSMRFGA